MVMLRVLTPTKIVYKIPNPMVILARFQTKIPVQDSDSAQVQDGYVIKCAQKNRCEEIEGGGIHLFDGQDSRFQGKILDSI